MNSDASMHKLCELLNSCTASVGHIPLSDEVEYHTLPCTHVVPNITISQDKDANPFECARACMEALKEERVCVYVPGQAFDASGNRRGRGAGWYDRFLSVVPREWIRVGVTDSEHVSHEVLTTNSWDQPMDWVIVWDKHMLIWTAYEAAEVSS